MDDQKRLKKKRAGEELLKTISTDLNKKRKLDEQTAVQAKEKVQVLEQKEEKPWEQAKKEEEVDYRWDICENCQ